MSNEGKITASRAAIVVFSIVFLVCLLRGISVAGACLRGGLVAFATFVSVRIISHLFFDAVIDELSSFINKNVRGK